MKSIFSLFVVILLTLVLGFFTPFELVAQTTFTEQFKAFPRQEKNLRKWDAPVVADLDQDGFLDLLINDHGLGVQVQWNDGKGFSKPYDIIMGDLHGVAIGDIDNDNSIEVIMSRGGGSGSNARNAVIFRVTKKREFIALADFDEPLAFMRGRTVAFVDGDNDGDLDLLNFAFPDASKKGASENYIYENIDGQLFLHGTLPASKRNGQKLHLTDINGDGIYDIILFGNGAIKAYQGNGDLTYREVSANVFPYPIKNVSGISELDYDNDGDIDLYLTRGNEFEKGQSFFNLETKTLGFYTTRGTFQLDDLEAGEVLNLENFQSQWPNNDTYYIGESSYIYTFPGETHSGKNIRLVNSNALGFPTHTNFKDKTGWYIGYVGNNKWRIAGYLWAPSTGIVHGIKNYKQEFYKKGPSDVLLQNNNAKFKDVTKKTNLFQKGHHMASDIADFNNDGYRDILVIPRGKMVYENKAILFLNKAGKYFEKSVNHDIKTFELGAIGMAVRALDYNADGHIDVVLGNERGKWHLFKNNNVNSSTNCFLTLNIGKSPKKKTTPLGAIVKLTSCHGTQTQIVGSSNSQYSQGLNTALHFGLGNCKKIISVEVIWSNGEKLKTTTKIKNSTLHIGEQTLK